MSLEVKAIIALIFGVLLSGAIWLVDRLGYDRGVADCKAAQAKVDAKAAEKHEAAVVKADEGMQKANDAGEQRKAATEEKTKETIRTITKVIHDAPSPPACTVQPDSVRALADATARANAAADRLQGARSGPAPSSSAKPAQP